jgi:hypothetical protein
MVPVPEDAGRFYASGNLDVKREEARQLLVAETGKPFYKSVIAGAAGAGGVLAGYGLLLALAPCPACKVGLYAGLVALQGAGGLGALASTANVIGRYRRRNTARAAYAAFGQGGGAADAVLDPAAYAPLVSRIQETGLEGLLQRHTALLAELKKPVKTSEGPCGTCKKNTKQDLQACRKSIGSAYVSLEERARAIAGATPLPSHAVFTAIADSYRYCARVYNNKFTWGVPRGLLLKTQ